jgi:CheY-like chemotaxis protein
MNNSPTNLSSNSNRKSSKEKINTILKNKKKKMLNKNILNKYYNKTLSYSKSPKDMLFVIPEINENTKKERLIAHPSCKLNNKYVHEFAECDCNDILLVDDDEFICKTFKNILKKFKLKADCAENGKECLKLLKEKMEKHCKCDKNKYKIIFMDITMPVMDGIEAAKNIQQMIDNKEINDNIKIVFISAHANLDLSATISGIKCAVDYYAKPISADKYKHLLDQYYYKK